MGFTPSFDVQTCAITGPDALMYSPAGERWARSESAGEFEILHQHGIWQLFSRITARWRDTHRKPTIVAPHGSLEHWALQQSGWKKRVALWAYERSNLENATCIQATTSEEVAGIRAFGLRNPVAIIPNGIAAEWLDMPADADHFRRVHGIREGRRLMLFMSRFHRKKGLVELVHAFAAAQDAMKDWDLVLAGAADGPEYAAAVRTAIAKTGLAPRVYFVGELGAAEKRNALAACELFVLPTMSDNFAIVIAEALGAGVPVLTTEGAIAWRCLEEERCGWWIPNGVNRLAQALRDIAKLPSAELAEMGGRGAQLVRRKFLWSHAAERSIEVYRWIVGESARPDCVVS
jgi:glycosyltransferase involved in cell wall biosynthesis